eukprot:8763701-Pyramimonas_sp.AAC.1
MGARCASGQRRRSHEPSDSRRPRPSLQPRGVCVGNHRSDHNAISRHTHGRAGESRHHGPARYCTRAVSA